jgi:NitT/TauT family transport system ATP-binding protein
MPNPKRTIAGSILVPRVPHHPDFDFPDLLGQECGVRQDTRIKPQTGKSQTVDPPSPLADTTAGGILLRGVGHAYGELRTLDFLDLAVDAHGVVGLVGPSGCGKSTLLELICGLREQSDGTIEVGGHAPAAERLARCAFMPQRDLLLPWYSAIDNASLALRNRGVGRREARRRTAELFERFGLSGFESARPAELSGGMRQRVAFLRTLVAAKPVLALDEPFASLDAITRAEMQGWLAQALREEPRTVVFVTHDVEEALYLCDKVAVLSSRPARIVAELEAPAPRVPDRDAAVTDRAFVAVRERAMRALREGSR